MDCETAKIRMFLLTAPSSGVNTMSKFTWKIWLFILLAQPGLKLSTSGLQNCNTDNQTITAYDWETANN